MVMRYPVHPSTPFTGDLPPLTAWPSDLMPSGNNPMVDHYRMVRGRYLAGLGQDDVPVSLAPDIRASPGEYGAASVPSADGPEYKDYPNELETLAELDDIQNNGIFDPPNSHGNIHPDAGVFAGRFSLPGYLARERFFRPSEVIDATTGDPIMFVPGNGFMLDPRTGQTLADISLYEPGMPDTGGVPIQGKSTWIPDEAAWPVERSGLAQADTETPEPREPASKTVMFVAAGIAGLGLGLVAGLAFGGPKMRQNRKRRRR